MSKTLLNVGAEKRGRKRKQASEEPKVEEEVPAVEAVKETQTKKKPKRKANEEAKQEDNEEQLIVQPNAKKVKLSSNLRPVTASSNAKGSAATSGSKLSSVVYLGHLPKGFDEDEIRKFFNQFGKIKRMKLFRAKKSLVSKGYAFLEFETEEIAKVVVEAMNGYFLMERKLVAEHLTPDRVHDGLFLQPLESRLIKKIKSEGSDDEEGLELIADAEEAENQLVITEENFDQIYERHQQYTQKKQSQLTEKGVDYHIPIVSKTGEMIVKVKEIEDQEKETQVAVVESVNKQEKVTNTEPKTDNSEKKGNKQKKAANKSKSEPVPEEKIEEVEEVKEVVEEVKPVKVGKKKGKVSK
eukprot:gene10592-11532_t